MKLIAAFMLIWPAALDTQALKAIAGQTNDKSAYGQYKDCIGPMGVAKMQALEIKLQRAINNTQTKCMMRDRRVDDYAKEQARIVRGDATVFELEKCDQQAADDFRARVDAFYQEGKPTCKP